jgi:hypothetical protein
MLIRGVERQDLFQIRLGKHEASARLRWIHAREFEYNGKMYDVVEQEFSFDSVVYSVWADHAETQLNRQLESLLIKAMGGHPQNRDQQKRLADFFKSLYSSPFQSRDPEIQSVEITGFLAFYQFFVLQPTFRLLRPRQKLVNVSVLFVSVFRNEAGQLSLNF